MNMSPLRGHSCATLLAALLISASSSFTHNRVEAVKLTSLGSTFDSLHVKNTDSAAAADRGDAPEGALDYSSMACSPPDGKGSSAASSSSLATCSSSYGVDNSFPIHHYDQYFDSSSSPSSAEFELDYFEDFMDGCRDYYDPDRTVCNGSEMERMEMNRRQPAGMYNYTTLGFHKVRAPTNIINPLTKFWKKQFTSVSNIRNETWPPGDTHTNHWSSPTKMLNLDHNLRKAIWDGSKSILEEWTGVELSPSSLYGVRVYTEGAVLAPHVDRMPLVISAIVNVAQDVDEPWPLEVYGHDGKAYNITMEVGDMIFYESHSVIHGRPFALKGRHFANVFIHFEPLGHTLLHEERNAEDEESLEFLYQQAWKRMQSKCIDDAKCEGSVDLNNVKKAPHYIVPGSEEERRWIQTHPKAHLDASKDTEWAKGLNAHTAASSGDLDALIAIAVENPDALRHRDNNGWNPLHEAVRGGHVEIVKFLLKGGLDKNERTHTGNGGSPLWWAKKTHGNNHPMVQYLEEIGADEVPPDGHNKIEEK